MWDRYLAPEIVFVDENDAIMTRAELLKALTPLPAGIIGTTDIDQWSSQTHGDVAVTTHENQEHVDVHGAKVFTRFRSTDTWLRTPAGWKMIAEHTMAVLKDPPAMAHPPKCDQAGRYRLSDLEATITCADGGITITRADRPATAMKIEAPDVFFTPASRAAAASSSATRTAR